MSCLLGLAACGGAARQPATGSARSQAAAHLATTTVARCQPAALAIAQVGSQGATGHIEAMLQLRNTAATPCALYGYPGALMLDAHRSPLHTQVLRGGGFFPDTRLAPRRVVLGPGRAARFGLSFSTSSESEGHHDCPVAAWLLLTPPNDYTQLSLALAGTGWPRFAPCGGQIFATPLFAV